MYWDARPDYRVVEGEHTEGPFNRSAAINAAAKLAGNWDVAVIADADTWVPYAQLDEAVRLARRRPTTFRSVRRMHGNRLDRRRARLPAMGASNCLAS